MNLAPSVHTDVRDLLFADWAEPVDFLEVSMTYNPLTGESSESVVEYLVLAILGPGLNAAEPNTAHQHTHLQRSFLLRAEDLPQEASFATSRIRCHGREYSLLTADHALQTNLVAFNAIARE
jgi:hypothetical protein